MDQGSSLAKPLYLRDSVNRLPNLNLTADHNRGFVGLAVLTSVPITH